MSIDGDEDARSTEVVVGGLVVVADRLGVTTEFQTADRVDKFHD